MNNKYNIPKTKKEKAELLKALMSGEKTIEDLKEDGFKITLWKEDETDSAFLKTFDGKQRISREEYEARRLANPGDHITLELDKKD